MKIAIIGSSGYIAGYLLDRFKKESFIESILKIGQSSEADLNLNLLQPELFDYSLLENIDYVVFTAAISAPDKCAIEFDFCWNINVIGTKYFIAKAIEKKCKVLFFSSDAVFGDIPGYIYSEHSETKTSTPYGRMKKDVEDTFKESRYFKAIRLSYVTSAKDSFVTYCLSCIKNGDVANVYHPLYRNCIVANDVADVVVWLAKNWNDFNYFVLNVAGKELVSRVRIADELNRHLGNRLKYTISNPGDAFFQNRPQITQMESLYINKYHIIEDNNFTEKIKKELEDIKL